MATGTLSDYLDHLVAEARASRDGVVNRLDAIERQTRAVSEQLRARVADFERAHQTAETDERDDRFDPQDDDEDDYPQTWLR